MDIKVAILFLVIFVALFLGLMLSFRKIGRLEEKLKGETIDVKKSSKLVDKYIDTKKKINTENHATSVDNVVNWLSNGKSQK